jgi:hypothetical protein
MPLRKMATAVRLTGRQRQQATNPMTYAGLIRPPEQHETSAMAVRTPYTASLKAYKEGLSPGRFNASATPVRSPVSRGQFQKAGDRILPVLLVRSLRDGLFMAVSQP